MALTPSTMIPLGTPAPDFNLLDVVTEKNLSLYDLPSLKGTVILFICNHCPFVKHIHDQLLTIAHTYKAKGIQFIAINANDPMTYPEDAPDKMKSLATDYHYPFPYLFDETQAVAKAYDAACTPDFFLFDSKRLCVYRGQFDESRPNSSIPVTGHDLCQAMDCLLEGKAIPEDQRPSIGCNIKWKT